MASVKPNSRKFVENGAGLLMIIFGLSTVYYAFHDPNFNSNEGYFAIGLPFALGFWASVIFSFINFSQKENRVGASRLARTFMFPIVGLLIAGLMAIGVSSNSIKTPTAPPTTFTVESFGN